ncbi:tRNA (guanosine(37)-N1)-methyltransferase TrmD [candidate division WWE3 bacterium]|uniref:tRNA (guanine-N(1)-)-methyltransferase n=1 Tax=candidate division WWE3 bacterium TaxID=2053526 RepID=A0A955LKD0_UNCKA|nr:tRNA (guanosine(37)-N1)-methyltransferase TrmD [candidate division WWE3 bacterium]
MTFSILTLFPKMFKGPFGDSILKRAQKDELIEINIYNIRDWAEGKHEVTDDEPYGGGVGMVMKPEPIFKGIEVIKKEYYKTHGEKDITHTILLTPKGQKYNYRITEKLAELSHLILVCGHYEGVDHRVFENAVNERISIGDYILTGGELPAMVVVESVSRYIDGVLGESTSKDNESFQYGEKGILKYPVYTRPEEYDGMKVPDVLLSGNHREIERWREEAAVELTEEYRPDLLGKKSGYF